MWLLQVLHRPSVGRPACVRHISVCQAKPYVTFATAYNNAHHPSIHFRPTLWSSACLCVEGLATCRHAARLRCSAHCIGSGLLQLLQSPVPVSDCDTALPFCPLIKGSCCPVDACLWHIVSGDMLPTVVVATANWHTLPPSGH